MPSRTLIQLPKEFKGRQIRQRIPFVMSGDLIVPAGQSRAYPDGLFSYNQDLPFEVVRMIPNVTSLDSNAAPQADPNIGALIRFVQLTMQALGSVRQMTLNATRLSALLQKDELEWDFEAPYYLERGTGFQITVNNAVPIASAAGGIRMEIGFLGSLLDIG